MRKVDIDKVIVGSKLAQNIYNAKGQKMLNVGVELTADYIERLKQMGYSSVFIDDGLIDDINLEQVISELTRVQAVNCVREAMDDIYQGKTIQVSAVKKVVNNIIEDLINNREMMLNLSDIRTYDNYTFNHSVNVTVISIMIGQSLYYSKDKLLDLGMGVLLHDIGKTQIPQDIINKPAKLTDEEFETVQKHTWHGFEILRKNPEIKITSAHVALQHHERYDGSGYPRQLKGNNILEYARISAIADVYDALTNERCYRKKVPVFKAYEYLQDNSGSCFDPGIVERFVQKIALFPQGTKVRLTDGRSGLVIKQNHQVPERPKVRLFWYDKKELTKPVDLNLIEYPTLAIASVLEA